MRAKRVQKTTVIHVQSGKRYDVYIGRPSDWGNPFQIGVDGTRQECIELYRRWLRAMRPDLIERAKQELKGKVLGCWCKPEACHGDVLASICNEE
ncbi:MAG: DUF4326 domain-containing protein [bacterium]